MAKLADFSVRAQSPDDRNVVHEARYSCSVTSDGTFNVPIDDNIVETIKALSLKMRGDNPTRLNLNKKGETLLSGDNLDDIKAVLYAYSKSMIESEVVDELRIFYILKLDAPYYKSGDGRVLPNGSFVQNYENDGGKWHGHRATSMSTQVGSIVGCGARIYVERCTKPKDGEPSFSYIRVGDTDLELGPHGKLLAEWTQQPWPRDDRGKRSTMLSIPYTEEAAAMFCNVIERLAMIADQLETHLKDCEALPALIAGGSMPLLSGPKQ